MPLVSVLLAVHDGAPFLSQAVESILRQSVGDLELIVVDDASTDDTRRLLAAIRDPRLVVLRNDERAGLAASLNRALDEARGRYVARLDADDVAAPERLERQLARIRADPPVAVVGTGVVDVDESGRLGRTHLLPDGPTALRWHALFSSPFFHPTVLVDREVLERHGLRYDPAYLESEDYDLWTRLFTVADGSNLAAPLVRKRVHAGQASTRRSDLQRSFQRQVALREIARVAPELAPDHAELAWSFACRGAGAPRGGERAYLMLLEAFERRHGVDRAVRAAAARRLARSGRVTEALRLAPDLPVGLVLDGVRRLWHRRATRRQTAPLGPGPAPSAPVPVTVVSPEPTPYRSPLFDRVAARADVDLTVVYAARSVAGRSWHVEPRHRSIFLRGLSVPGLRRVLRHDYPVTPGIRRALHNARPAVVVVSGWSTFASQAAIAWSRAHGIPYVLLVESHDLGPRAPWRRAVKRAVVPPLVRGAAGILVVGTLARESLIARGAAEERIRTFANTIDVAAWEERADRLARTRQKLRAGLAFGDDDVVVLSVARLAPEKGLDTLVRAVAAAGEPRLAAVVVGAGPQASSLVQLAESAGVRLLLVGELPEDRVAELYAAADVFALLSTREPWGVVVNEAAASALPLVLSDRVGAARDLLSDENGVLVPSADVAAAAAALARLAGDPELRRAMGRRSREVVRGWGYEPSVESFVATVRAAIAR